MAAFLAWLASLFDGARRDSEATDKERAEAIADNAEDRQKTGPPPIPADAK